MQCLPFEVDGRVGEPFWNGDAGACQPLALPFLRRRMIDFEDSETRSVRAIGESVEARAQHDVLVDASGCRFGKTVLGVAAPDREEGSHARSRGLGVTVASGAKVFGGLRPDHPQSQGVGKYKRNIDDLMCGPVKGGKVYGKWPGLDQSQLYEARDLAVTTDFRNVLGEGVVRHLGNTHLEQVFPGFSVGQFLNFLG